MENKADLREEEWLTLREMSVLKLLCELLQILHSS